MNRFHIKYHRNTDTLCVHFYGNYLNNLRSPFEKEYPYGFKLISKRLDEIQHVAYTVNHFAHNRAAALKNILATGASPVDDLNSYVDKVLQSHPRFPSPALDFYEQSDGEWKEIDQTYDCKKNS